jgi:hypothetical protein
VAAREFYPILLVSFLANRSKKQTTLIDSLLDLIQSQTKEIHKFAGENSKGPGSRARAPGYAWNRYYL